MRRQHIKATRLRICNRERRDIGTLCAAAKWVHAVFIDETYRGDHTHLFHQSSCRALEHTRTVDVLAEERGGFSTAKLKSPQ